MLSTLIFVSLFIGILLCSFALWVLLLRVGLRWAKVRDVTMRRVVVTAAIVFILQIGINLLFLYAEPNSDAPSIVFSLLELAGAVIVPCVVIRAMFKARLLRVFQAWLPTLLANTATLAFVLLVLRPFILEAFVVPTNSMAPTLVGKHWRGQCTKCGQPNYCSPRDERFATADPLLMICDRFHVTEAGDLDRTVHSGDRFLVGKLFGPRRWDLVVFQYPADPSTQYVMRLVGLPGEKILIQDGAVWVDGEKQTPPDFLRGIEYLSELPNWFGPDLWGSSKRPALLGKDEFMILGDFSAQSMDSRLWEEGAPGYHPFAVPESHLKGVVTHTYWPPHRWRIHR